MTKTQVNTTKNVCLQFICGITIANEIIFGHPVEAFAELFSTETDTHTQRCQITVNNWALKCVPDPSQENDL